MTSGRFQVHGRGWLLPVLRAYLETHDPQASDAAVQEVLRELPDVSPDVAAGQLALRRLATLGLRPARHLIPAALVERVAELGFPPSDLDALGVLATEWDILMDIARLHGNRSSPQERAIEVLTVLALGLRDYRLAQALHQLHLETLAAPADPAPFAARLEPLLAERGSGRSSPMGVGLAYVEARTLARIASLYFERSAIEEDGVAQLHRLSQGEKIDLIYVLMAVAWADGKVTPEERRLVEQQIELADLDAADARALLVQLKRGPRLDDADLVPIDAATRRFILEQAILLSLVDDDQTAAEVELLRAICTRLGGSEDELEGTLVEVAAFYERHRDTIHDFGPVSGALGRLSGLVYERVREAVQSNTRKLLQEVRETGELARLLGAASVRTLTHEEAEKVKSQLLDICKTIPALAIFALPGGGLLVPVLLKVLPFNILPTAFSEPAKPPPPPSPRA